MIKIFEAQVDGCYIKAGIAETDEELTGAYSIRWREYVAKRQQISRQEVVEMAEQHNQPELIRYFDHDLEVDYCDPVSTSCIISVDGRIIACLRLTAFGYPWRLDEYKFNGKSFSLPDTIPGSKEKLDPSLAVEAARFLTGEHTTINGWRLNLSFLVLSIGLEACRIMGKKFWVLAGNVRILEHLREHGWPFNELIPGEYEYHGSRVRLAYLRVPDTSHEDYLYTLIKPPR